MPPKRGPRGHAAPTEEIRLDEVVYQYPGKGKVTWNGTADELGLQARAMPPFQRVRYDIPRATPSPSDRN